MHSSEVYYAFQFYKGSYVTKTKIRDLNITNELVYYGDAKGFVSSLQISIADMNFSLNAFVCKPISKKSIDKLEFLHNSKTLIVLSHGTLYFLDNEKLSIKKQLGKGVTNFTINQHNGQIIVSYGKKIQYLAFDYAANEVFPLPLGKGAELLVSKTILKLVWNENVLGAVLKKSYSIIDLRSGNIINIVSINNTENRYLGVFKDLWIAKLDNVIKIFERNGKPVPNSDIVIPNLGKANPIVSLIIHNCYLLILRETAIQVFNLLDYSLIQTLALEKTAIGRGFFSSDNKILISIERNIKKSLTNEVLCLHSIPPDEQVRILIRKSRIVEAQKVFAQNNFVTESQFASKKEEFNIDAGWKLFEDLEFEKACYFLASTNYDPREFLALIPGLIDSETAYKTLNDLVAEKYGKSDKAAKILKEGRTAIVKLVEDQRKNIEKKYDINKDEDKIIDFVYSCMSLNRRFKSSKVTLKEVLEVVDNSLIKLYLQENNIDMIQQYFEDIKVIRCNHKLIYDYFKAYENNVLAKVCLGYLHTAQGDYMHALEIWKVLGNQEIKQIQEIACKETIRILINHIKDKKLTFEYAKAILDRNPIKGLMIFTDNPSLEEFITEDEVIAYFEKFDDIKIQLKEKYLEHLVNTKEKEGRFHTLLGQHYIFIIKAVAKSEDKLIIEFAKDSIINKYRDKLNTLLKNSNSYYGEALLEEIRGSGLWNEEILIYSKQKMHSEALSLLIELGKNEVNFTRAEEYCLEQPEQLLSVMFEKLVRLIKKQKEALSLNKKVEEKLTTKHIDRLNQYCRDFLKRYATNGKLNAETILDIIPEDWDLIEIVEEDDDRSLLDYLKFTFNNSVEKVNRLKVAKKIADMYKLNLDADLAKLQSANLIVNPDSKCKVCGKIFKGAKSFYVYPNGTLTHPSCIKSTNICPVTNINFLKRIYE